MKNLNFEMKIGKTAQDNWNILNESSQTHTILHLNSFSSPYVIINKPINQLSKSEITVAAQSCKEHSKYKNYQNLKIFYTSISNVTKADKIGSFHIISRKKLKYINI
jgi:hypothetical protein